MKLHVARDQYGNVWWLGKHPRKELLEKLGKKHADRMYRDPNARHIGWIIGGHWIEVMQCKELHN